VEYTIDHWESVFAEEDPWRYADSEYEAWKFNQTLSILRRARPKRALEIGCAEGHLTSLMAQRVGALTAIDISPTAISRARKRCKGLKNVSFKTLDFLTEPLPGRWDLIVCSEVLFYLPLAKLDFVAEKIAGGLEAGGLLLLAHGNQVSDEPGSTGFDWGHPFGPKTIGEAFGKIDGLHLLRQNRTPLFTIQLFRRNASNSKRPPEVESLETPLPPDLELDAELEKTIIWGGTRVTRDAAKRTEIAVQTPILMYHAVRDGGPPELAPYRVSPAAFREQLRWLRRNGYYSITLAEWAERIRVGQGLPGRPIIITFDDGYEDVFQNAWPELERADFSATVFAVTDKVGGEADWDEVTGPPLKLMGWRELEALAEAGVTVGSHNALHKNLLELPARQIEHEGLRARAAIKEKLGVEAECFAYPWGMHDAKVRAALQRCGYRIAVTTEPGRASLNDDVMALPRIEILGQDDLTAFAAKLEGAEATPIEVPAAAPAGPHFHAVKLDKSGERADLLGGGMSPIRPDYARELAARMDALVGEFVRLQNQLLNELKAPASLQSKLAAMFAQPLTGRVTRALESGQSITPHVELFFNKADEATLTFDVKTDHVHSPPNYLNLLKLDFVGSAGWAWFEVELEWGELANARNFQIGLYAQANRTTEFNAALILPTRNGEFNRISLANLELRPDLRNALGAGDLTVPDFINFNVAARPKLQLLFDIDSDLSLLLHYVNIYFA
jgi:peptidoglycan/xylan/chitin deacetylase (PgdA/CDA1 family)/SAM-dependent methyltransferase